MMAIADFYTEARKTAWVVHSKAQPMKNNCKDLENKEKKGKLPS